MQRIVASFLLLLVGVAPANGDAHVTSANPVVKVVELIQELKAKVEADGKTEQKVYDKFACWCEKTTARKAAAIEKAKTDIADMQQMILELTAKIATLGAEIKQLEKDIASGEEAVTEAQALREKENAAYVEERSESEQCIGALEHAIKVLTGAGEGRKAKESAIQEADMLSVAAGIRTALRKVPKDTMTPEDLKTMRSFVDRPMDFWSSKGVTFSGAQIAQNPFGDYAPASTVIQGILKQMYDDFTSSLEQANADEASKQKEFEDLFGTKLAELATLKSTLAKKTEDNANSKKDLADTKLELEATKQQLEEDEKFFEETKEACKAKATDWAERSRLRTEELAGMNKAIQILTSDEAMGTFDRAHSTFLQISSEVDSGSKVDAKRNGAYTALKSVASRFRSLRLASLAATVRTAEGGHFDKVIVMIDKMIETLRKEEQEDIENRDWCEAKENKYKNQKEDMEYKIGQTEGLIERLEAKSSELEEQIAATQSEITATEEAMAEALAQRNQESQDFKDALKDDTDAVALLAQAIEALTSFYTNNKIPLGSLLQKKEPEYTVDPDKAPETPGFEKPYGGRSSESQGIIAILSMIKEDLENEVVEGKKSETAAAAEFAKMRASSLKTLAALKQKKNEQSSAKADVDEKKSQAEATVADTKAMKDEKQEELESITPNCEWLKTAFDSRREKRKAEIDGLIQAKGVLAGATAEESAPAALVQTSFLARSQV